MSAPLLVVFSMPGREELTQRTLAELDGRGGAAGPGRFLSWTSTEPPPFKLGRWALTWQQHAPRGGRADFWEMLRHFEGSDLIVVEDDVQPCTNFVPYASAWETPPEAAFTTFFNGRREPPGAIGHPLGPDRRGYWFSQALKLPAWFVQDALAMGRELEGIKAQDVALGYVAEREGLGIYYHRSLVQHVGEASVGAPGAQLVGKRAPAADFVGADFDALTLR